MPAAPSTAPAPTPGPPLPAAPGARGPPLVDRGTVRHDTVRSTRWVTRGITKVDRDVDVGRADLRGTVTVGGSLGADQLTVDGSLDVHGGLRARARLRTKGSLAVAGPVAAGEAVLIGAIRLRGELSAERAVVARGTLQAPSLQVGALTFRGAATVPGTIRASTVTAQLVADSSLGQVVAQTVRLRGPAPAIVVPMLGEPGVVTVDRVEAESVFVEGAHVAFVRAGAVTLGRGAHVTAVEGTVVRAHPTSRLGPESWSRPPAGLSR